LTTSRAEMIGLSVRARSGALASAATEACTCTCWIVSLLGTLGGRATLMSATIAGEGDDDEWYGACRRETGRVGSCRCEKEWP
jgi:hypothetical protein